MRTRRWTATQLEEAGSLIQMTRPARSTACVYTIPPTANTIPTTTPALLTRSSIPLCPYVQLSLTSCARANPQYVLMKVSSQIPILQIAPPMCCVFRMVAEHLQLMSIHVLVVPYSNLPPPSVNITTNAQKNSVAVLMDTLLIVMTRHVRVTTIAHRLPMVNMLVTNINVLEYGNFIQHLKFAPRITFALSKKVIERNKS